MKQNKYAPILMSKETLFSWIKENYLSFSQAGTAPTQGLSVLLYTTSENASGLCTQKFELSAWIQVFQNRGASRVGNTSIVKKFTFKLSFKHKVKHLLIKIKFLTWIFKTPLRQIRWRKFSYIPPTWVQNFPCEPFQSE